MRMSRKILVVTAALIISVMLWGQHGSVLPSGKAFLSQLQKRDSVLIADQVKYGFRLEGVKNGTELNLPDMSEILSDIFADSVEVVNNWKLDTLKVHKRAATNDLEGSVTITSFEEGKYRLPDVYVQRISPDGTTDTLVFEGLPLDVRTMPVDTASFQVHDIKGQIRYPLTFKELLPYILVIWGIAIIVILIWAYIRTRKRKENGEASVKEPPYITALKKLDHYRGNKFWAPEKQKQFYSGVTDVLREYIAARFGVGAMEMTTAEIFDGLKDKEIPQPLLDEARSLFVMSDLVKFAKLTVTDDENAKAVPAAVRFVTSTWKAEEEADANVNVNDKVGEEK